VCKGFVSARFGNVIMQFQATIATNCRAVTCFMNISYVVCHERAISIFSGYRIYYVSTDSLILYLYVDILTVVYHIKETVYG
jgi:hypothetical protein